MAGQFHAGFQFAARVELPDFLAELGGEEFRGEAPEVGGHVVDVALQHPGGVVVPGGVDRLGEVDDDRSVAADQHVVLGQVAVDHPGTEHEHDLIDQPAVVLAGESRRQFHVVEPGGGIALFVGHQLHQQDSPKVAVQLRDPHAGRGQALQRVNLRVLPGALLLPAAEAGMLPHGAGLAAVAHLAPFLVLGLLAEAAPPRFLVHLGAAHLPCGEYHVNLGFLAAHELADHLVDQAILDQHFETLGNLHSDLYTLF